jgi:hypothetical protein
LRFTHGFLQRPCHSSGANAERLHEAGRRALVTLAALAAAIAQIL